MDDDSNYYDDYSPGPTRVQIPTRLTYAPPTYAPPTPTYNDYSPAPTYDDYSPGPTRVQIPNLSKLRSKQLEKPKKTVDKPVDKPIEKQIEKPVEESIIKTIRKDEIRSIPNPSFNSNIRISTKYLVPKWRLERKIKDDKNGTIDTKLIGEYLSMKDLADELGFSYGKAYSIYAGKVHACRNIIITKLY